MTVTNQSVLDIVSHIIGIRRYALEVARDFSDENRFYIEMELKRAANAMADERETERQLRGVITKTVE